MGSGEDIAELDRKIKRYDRLIKTAVGAHKKALVKERRQLWRERTKLKAKRAFKGTKRAVGRGVRKAADKAGEVGRSQRFNWKIGHHSEPEPADQLRPGHRTWDYR